jgi:hypothetical protein
MHFLDREFRGNMQSGYPKINPFLKTKFGQTQPTFVVEEGAYFNQNKNPFPFGFNNIRKTPQLLQTLLSNSTFYFCEISYFNIRPSNSEEKATESPD